MLKSSMKFLVAALAVALQLAMMPATPAQAAWASFQAASSAGAAYTGAIDQYPSEGWTWGWAVYAPSSSYAGNFAVIERTSDSTTTTIGYSNHVADVSAFNTFCSGTYCFVKTLYDSFGNVEGHETDASQTTLADMPQINVANNGNLQICPTPTSTMATAYNAAFATAKVETFIVAYAAYFDWNGWQADLPYFTITGNTSTANKTISNVTESGVTSTFQNFSIASNGAQNSGAPGIEDITSNSALWWENYVATATLGATSLTTVQNFNSQATRTGDTFQLTNAVLNGPWITAGPANSNYTTSAYWTFGTEYWGTGQGGWAGDLGVVRNSNFYYPTIFGEQMRGRWAVWDWDTYNGILNYDGTQLFDLATDYGDAAANVTYGTNVGLTLFSNTNGAQNTSNQCFQQMALINQTAANRNTVSSWLDAQFGITALSTSASSYVDPDGFTLQPIFVPNSPQESTIYGPISVVDANNIKWHPQTGGYLHDGNMPTAGYATNVTTSGCTAGTNCPTKWRWIINAGDSDIDDTQHPRSEMDSTEYGGETGTFASATAGQHWSTFFQFKYEQIPDMKTFGGEWCLQGQIHYNNSGAPPDIFAFDCLDRTGAGHATLTATVNDVDCGSIIAITAGQVYAVEIEGYYNPSGVSSTVVSWGPNGAPLTNGCTSSSVTTDTGIYAKNGIYTGDVPFIPWQGVPNPQDIIYDSYNQVWSTTAGTFSSYITSQPALPTHP